MEENESEKLKEMIEIEELAIKIEEMSKVIKKLKGRIKEGTTSISKTTDQLKQTAVDKKVSAEKEIKENPLVYAIGAFFGGLIIGYTVARGRKLLK